MHTRVPSVPLITHDPYFSIWSPADHLYDTDTVHWTGKSNAINGNISIDGSCLRFMGTKGAGETMKQTALTITATASTYTFQGRGVELQVRFTSPLLLHDLELVSRPCSYIDVSVVSLDSTPHRVSVFFDAAETICHMGEKEPMFGGVHRLEAFHTAWMGKATQTPLNHSGDIVPIDWGFLYLALDNRTDGSVEYTHDIDGSRSAFLAGEQVLPDADGCRGLTATLRYETSAQPVTQHLLAAYDDVLSIQYFGKAKKAYWAEHKDPLTHQVKSKTALEMLAEAVAQHDNLLTRCDIFDAKLQGDTAGCIDEKYAAICNLAYRQTIAGHKLITDDDYNPIFISKECNSNGCMATVDISYPSVPLYLMFNPGLVAGMLRPIMKFSRLPVWGYDFAPHDVGRYPYACGQIYGLTDATTESTTSRFVENGMVFPMFYQYPVSQDIYEYTSQMPIEECGNMLIMFASLVGKVEQAFIQENMDLLGKWACYLVQYGEDPGEQLCTDDFAGHLAHNVNLSIKAIMGIAAYGLLLQSVGSAEEGDAFLQKARDLAGRWEEKFAEMDHTPLTFDQPDSWGMKYNIIWDKIFGTKLFSDSVFAREIGWYKKQQSKYGLPLDSRKNYTKSDWILWCAAFAQEKEDAAALIDPIFRFTQETGDRVPFSDWYDTVTAEHYYFQNRTVQSGLFMPLFVKTNNPKL